MYFEVMVTAKNHFVIEADTPAEAKEKVEGLGPTYHGWHIETVHQPKKLTTKEYKEMTE